MRFSVPKIIDIGPALLEIFENISNVRFFRQSVCHNNCVHRDGSAVELIGLCASVTRWLADISEQGKYPHTGVKRPSKGLFGIYLFVYHF